MRIIIELPDKAHLNLDKWVTFDGNLVLKVLDFLFARDLDDPELVFTSPLLEACLLDDKYTMNSKELFEMIERRTAEDAGQCES